MLKDNYMDEVINEIQKIIHITTLSGIHNKDEWIEVSLPDALINWTSIDINSYVKITDPSNMQFIIKLITVIGRKYPPTKTIVTTANYKNKLKHGIERSWKTLDMYSKLLEMNVFENGKLIKHEDYEE